MSKMWSSSILLVTWTCCVVLRAFRLGTYDDSVVFHPELLDHCVTRLYHCVYMCVCVYFNPVHVLVYLCHLNVWMCVWSLHFVVLYWCVCMHVFLGVPVFSLLPSQAGHDSRPTDPEQPRQDLFHPLPACLLQPGQKELHTGVRIAPTFFKNNYSVSFLWTSVVHGGDFTSNIRETWMTEKASWTDWI